MKTLNFIGLEREAEYYFETLGKILKEYGLTLEPSTTTAVIKDLERNQVGFVGSEISYDDEILHAYRCAGIEPTKLTKWGEYRLDSLYIQLYPPVEQLSDVISKKFLDFLEEKEGHVSKWRQQIMETLSKSFQP